jgi:hypothetical protein
VRETFSLAEGFQFVVQTDNERTGASDSGPLHPDAISKQLNLYTLKPDLTILIFLATYILRPQLALKIVKSANNF